MGRFFGDEVEKALRYLYYDKTAERGEEAIELLKKTVAGGGAEAADACCLLARCYCGPQYVWDGHKFTNSMVDDQKAEQLLQQSVECGSSMGVLVAMRSGLLTPELEKRMPFRKIKDAYDIILDKAEHGEPYCQYMIGNVYYWWDFLRIEEKDRSSFSSDGAFLTYLAQKIACCEEWFQKAFVGGMLSAGGNLEEYYKEGFRDLIAPQPEKEEAITRQGAELGYPYYQYFWGVEIEHKNPEQALELYKRALSGGEWRAYSAIGRIYAEGRIVPKDERYAVSCWEKGVERGSDSCRYQLGRAYLDSLPEAGLEKNPEKGYELLEEAYDNGYALGAFELGKCCFKGTGANQDYRKAREYLEHVTRNNEEVLYMLGYLYARGLGGPQDIAKGVEYLKKAGNWQPALEELKNYKRTLFGKWVRR